MKLLKSVKKKYKLFKQKKKSQKALKVYSKNNDISLSDSDLSRISLKIQGKNNVVRVDKLLADNGKLTIEIAGDNNVVEIERDCAIGENLKIYIGQIHPNFGAIHGVKCHIGHDCSIESCRIVTFNSNAEINIGTDCMISYNVNIFHTDAHPILDVKTSKIINKVDKLTIGDHVWLGANSVVLKNTFIAGYCIVGWGCVAAGRFLEPNCAIVGNPGRVVKTGVTWKANGSDGYIQNEK